MENDYQKQLLEDFTSVFDEDFSADVRFLFAQGLIRFREDAAGEPEFYLTTLGRQVAEEIIRQKEN